MKCIENLTGNYKSSARVIDGTLIISLPQAITPVVWRMELGNVRASALEVRNHENGTFVLTLKTPKGDVNDIAPFDTRGRAVQALMSISRAMEQAQGQLYPRAANMTVGASDAQILPAPRPAKRGRLITGIAATVLLLALITFFMNMGRTYEATLAAEQAPATGQTPAAAVGVPLSADDFLKNR